MINQFLFYEYLKKTLLTKMMITTNKSFKHLTREQFLNYERILQRIPPTTQGMTIISPQQ
ncbi:hypothetical protein A0H76_870 [Hepatospora eriocheir]|uniref:Uncharacterized protein n=1 Tax=Hepatospora eriocheir TaxID=1081669 RepID=A0A1X0QLJ8_9MICR|nr:hypothetical protein A0H76_870 [Hepatospora eriocheir]